MRVPSNRRHTTRGFTLIELMVALVLGLLLTLVVGYVYQGSRQTSRLQEASSAIQQNARLAFDRLARETRMAGFAGCSYQSAVNVVNGAPGYTALLTEALIGRDDGTIGTLPAGITRLRGDVLKVVSVDDSNDYRITDYNPNSAQFKVSPAHDIADGEILLATDCQQAAIFQVTNANVNNATIVHNTGNSVQPGNASKNLGFTDTSAIGARLFRLRSTYFYVGNNAYGVPSLMRLDERPGGNLSSEMIEGVEDMQIVYGVDDEGDGDVDRYVRADQVAGLALTNLTSTQNNWSRVLAARLSLLFASIPGEAVTERAQTYVFNGATVTPSDRRLRRAINFTIAIRNRL